MSDVRRCLSEGAARLAAADIDNPWREARLLLAHATGLEEAVLIGYPERPVGARAAFLRLVDRRAAREPVSRLIGRREFWSLDFAVTRATLDPRPDSEAVVEAALDCKPDRAARLRLADFGTGSGCLLAALLSEYPAAWGVGVERDPATAAVAAGNLDRLGLAPRAGIVVADWAAALSGPFDLIVANPPYIPTAKIAGLQPEVAKFDPKLALDGGPDGLAAIRRLIAALPALMTRGSRAVIEFGDGQAIPVRAIAAEGGLDVIACRDDLAGRPRCLVCGRAGY